MYIEFNKDVVGNMLDTKHKKLRMFGTLNHKNAIDE